MHFISFFFRFKKKLHVFLCLFVCVFCVAFFEGICCTSPPVYPPPSFRRLAGQATSGGSGPGPLSFFIFGLIYQLLPPDSSFFVKGNMWLLVDEFWVAAKAWATIALVSATQGGATASEGVWCWAVNWWGDNFCPMLPSIS